MPPPSRFAASKWRNSVAHVPGKEEWYRGQLPGTTTSSSSTSTFSSEIKANREWIVSLTPGGDLSYRKYKNREGDEGDVKRVTGLGSGGGVGDWDLSRLEGGTVVIGGLDGSISVHALPAIANTSTEIKLVHSTTSTSSPITHLALHPTTPDILLASTASTPLAIFDLSSPPTSPTITLTVSEPKGLWSTAWSADGRLVAAIGKSGTAYIFDPRTSTDPVTSSSLPIQPLKPARIAWVGDDVFVTSTSRMRNREYHVFSGKDLSTNFTTTLDTSPGVLMPIVDHDRGLVYLTGKGDMTLRQIELSGPQGYQETMHQLPSPVAGPSIALAHPATLPVMQAQIASVLLQTTDKDGDTVIPLGVRVPRRQLIDYHEDLYPDPTSSIPEQTGEEWLRGGDKLPLPFSLDPSRRNTWEQQFQTKPSARQVENASAFEAESISKHGSENTVEPTSTPVVPVAPVPSSVQSNGDPDDARPPLQDDETYASTSYKSRIIGHHIGQQLELHRNAGKKGPLMVGLQGPQGCGKTTLCDGLVGYLKESPRNLRAAVLSIDDMYKTNAGLKDVARQNPENHLLQGRGPPGTHDIELATRILSEVEKINDENGTKIGFPIFDKSLCDGEGDRSEETVAVDGPLDIFLLEGWSMGFCPLSEEELPKRYEEKTSLTDFSYFTKQPLSSLTTLNRNLKEFAEAVYPPFGTIIQVEPESYDYVFQWRLQQEQNMKAKNGGKGMTDDQVRGFVERYMPGYELWKGGIWSPDRPWAGRGLQLRYGQGREVLQVDRPSSGDTSTKSTPAPDSTSQSKPAPIPSSSATNVTSAAPVSSSTPSKSLTQPAAQSSTDVGKPVNPNWSRKFLSGKSPLIPTYDQVPGVATLHQDSLILKCSPELAFFPITGPGGRLLVHPLSKKGRMTTGGEGFLSGGSELVDFAVDPFSQDGSTRVTLAGEDGGIRIWDLGAEGVQGAGPGPDLTMDAKDIGKITQISFNPLVKDLLMAVASSSLHFFELSASKKVLSVPVDDAVFNAAWSMDGTRIAVASKQKQILVLDPWKPDQVMSGPAHDSPRSFQIVWIDEDHLISVGFSRGSQQCLNLYVLPSDGEKGIMVQSSLLLDTSPSVLFPIYDPDTKILFLWGKGDRQIRAFEIRPENNSEPMAVLPSFTSGSPQLGVAFFPKAIMDVKKVEVARALRLNAKSLEDVSFTIPRNKPDFFQDDVYVPTLDRDVSSITAAEWLDGTNPTLKYKSLRPNDMTPLSQAPQTPSKAKVKYVPSKDVMSEQEKKKQEMDRVFAKAKMDESSDEEVQNNDKLAAPDDDWD